MVDLQTEFHGKQVIEFTNGEFKTVDVDVVVHNGYGTPIYFLDVRGRKYNWGNIISVKKSK